MTTITIVTPWRDHRELERDYFNTIRHENAALLIVDDGSDPRLPNGLRLEGVGFARACNHGLAHARTEAVLFLNNDVVGQRGWLEPIRAALEPGVLVGAELRADPHGSVDGTLLPYLDGWCLAGMRNDLLELGGFDETFDEPSYYGDNDLCLRARAVGMSLCEARVPLRHLRNRTTGGAENQRTREATLANRDRFVSRARQLLEVT